MLARAAPAQRESGVHLFSGKSKSLSRCLSAAFYAAYGFTGAFGRNLCKFTFPQRRRNLRKSLLFATRPTGVKRGKKMTALKITLANA